VYVGALDVVSVDWISKVNLSERYFLKKYKNTSTKTTTTTTKNSH